MVEDLLQPKMLDPDQLNLEMEDPESRHQVQDQPKEVHLDKLLKMEVMVEKDGVKPLPKLPDLFILVVTKKMSGRPS